MYKSNTEIWYMAQGYAIRGGHEAHLLHFASEMRRRGFITKIVVPNRLPRTEHLFMTQLRERGIPLESIADSVSHRATGLCVLGFVPWALREWLAGRRPAGSRLHAYITGRCVAAALSDKIAKEQPDIIHIMGRLADDLWSVLPAERCVFHHGTEGKVDASWTPEELRHFVDFAERAAVNLAPGRGVVENVHREFGIKRPIETLFTICPDVPGAQACAERRWQPMEADGRLSPPHDGTPVPRHPDTRFGILCRMTEEKGLTILLEAIRLYRDQHGAVDFTFAGKGPMDAAITAFIERHRLRGVRQIADFDSPVDVLRDLDVFVHPSLSDAMPLAIVEALMCGLPCIATPVGGIPDLIRDGDEGMLVPSGQPLELMAAMERFAAMDAASRNAFRGRARARYEAMCLPESVGDQLMRVYGLEKR